MGDWNKNVSDDEDDEPTQLGSNVVKDQGKVGGNAPKSLKDLLANSKQEVKRPATSKYQNKNQEQNVRTTEKGEKKPRFMNSTGVKNKNAPLSNNADTNNKQQQYTSSNTYGTNSGKPNFSNSKGAVNNNTPFDKDAKVEKTERTKITGTFQKTNDQNDNVKAPKKDYLEGNTDVKYKEEIDV